MKLVGIVLTAALLFGTAACQSTRVQIPTAPIGPNEKSLGPTWGDDVGMLLFGFIPIRQNDRSSRLTMKLSRRLERRG